MKKQGGKEGWEGGGAVEKITYLNLYGSRSVGRYSVQCGVWVRRSYTSFNPEPKSYLCLGHRPLRCCTASPISICSAWRENVRIGQSHYD